VEKRENHLCREIVLVNSMIQIICKNRTAVVSAFEHNGSGIKQLRRSERSDVSDCFSGLSERAETMYISFTVSQYGNL
jgi:hypothetical protein